MSQTQRNTAPKTCAWCTGTGKRAISAGYIVSCMVCGGKGNVLIAHPAGQCQQCQGSGRRNSTSSCLACAGTGWGRVFSQG